MTLGPTIPWRLVDCFPYLWNDGEGGGSLSASMWKWPCVSSRSASQPACGKREKAKKETRAAAANHPSHTPAVPNLHQQQPSTNTSGTHSTLHTPHIFLLIPPPSPARRPCRLRQHIVSSEIFHHLPSSRRLPRQIFVLWSYSPTTTAVALPLDYARRPTYRVQPEAIRRSHIQHLHLGTKLVSVTTDPPPMPASHT
jgi:hypothetical protein